MNTSRVMIPALLAAALIGGTMTSDAFAGPHHRGQGNGYGPCYGYGDGGCWEGGWGHHGHARGWGYRAMSDAQRAKFDKIMEEFAPRMEQLRDSIYVKRQELRALENATNPDVKAVREAATEMARLRNEMADLHDALGDKLAAEVGVPEGFKDALAARVRTLRGELETLTDLTERTTNDVSDTSDMVTDRISRINKYANSAETTVSDLVGQLREDMTIEEFQEWLQKVGESSDAIHGDLSGIGNEMDGLTSGLVSANKTLSADLRAVNDQLNSTMNLFLTLVDEVTTGSGDVTKDVSEDTLYSAKRGKAVDCVNRGTVEGDRNVGGIVGALAIEYDYDREDDLLPSGSRTGKYTYLTRAILLDCDNYGAVTAKKSCAGSVAVPLS